MASLKRSEQSENLSIAISYTRDADLLRLRYSYEGTENLSGMSIFPFSIDDGVSVSSFIVVLGYDEDEGVTTGDVIAIEIPFFIVNYPNLRKVLTYKIERSIEFDDKSKHMSHIDDLVIDYSFIDEDISDTRANLTIFHFLVETLDWCHGTIKASGTINPADFHLLRDSVNREFPVPDSSPGVRAALTIN